MDPLILPKVHQRPPKWPAVLFTVVCIESVVFWFAVVPQLRQLDYLNAPLALTAITSAVLWFWIHVWALYHLVSQIFTLTVATPPPHDGHSTEHIFFTVLYVTADDFD